MADKKADATEKNSAKKGGGLMALISKIMGALAILCVAILLAGLYDVGGAGMKKSIAPLAIVLVGVYVLFSLVSLFLGGGSSADVDTEALMAKIEDVQKKNTSRLIGFQNKIDVLMGQDYETLLAENKELQSQLDAIKDAEREKVDNQMEELRQRNEELEEQMKKWAMETVDSAISRSEGGDQAKAA